MEDILRFYLITIADSQLAPSVTRTAGAGADGDACFVRWERFAKDPRQLGKGALAAAPELPKIIVRQHLTPVFELGRLVRVICRAGSLEELITPLAGHKLDVVLA
jgi:hypothetical protein